jgi:D-3-phosphoglycerate dehydrogenase / 2-oxoglutarate reductase
MMMMMTITPNKPTVLVTDQINQQAVAILEPTCTVIYKPTLSAEELLALIPTVDGLMVRSASQVNASVMAAAPNLQIVGRAGVGVDNVDLATANQKGIVVVNSPEGNTIAAAEHTTGLLFALARHIPRGDASLKQGQWNRKALTGVELFGKTLGLIGLGKIGGRVAKACHTLGMKIVVYDPFVSASVAEGLGATLVTLEEIWAKADFITVHVPKTPQTANLINKNTLALCKAGVRFINCARGGIINEADLAEALRSGHVAGAALDVFETEPLATTSPLLAPDLADKLVLTPHLGASTEEAQVNVALDVAEQLVDFFATGTAKSAVNMPLLKSAMLDPVRPFMPLCEVLGKVVRQLAQGPALSLEVLVKGTLVEQNIAPLGLAVLKGLLSLSRESVNYVNAPFIAEELGLKVTEAKTKASSSFSNLVSITLTTAQGTHKVSGTLLSSQMLRIVEIDGFRASLKPTPSMMMVPHEDKPGMVAKVATVLGDANINISSLQVGEHPTGSNMMIFNLDSPATPSVLTAIQALEGCYGATALSV